MPARSPAKVGPDTMCAAIWRCTPTISSRRSASINAMARSTIATCRNGTSASPTRASRSCRAPTTSTSSSSAAKPGDFPRSSPAGATCRPRYCAASKPPPSRKHRSASTAPAIFKKEGLPMKIEPDQIVFDPRGVVETEPLALSPRARDLSGLRLGVLDNTKWNANRLLRKTAARLQEEFAFAAVNYYRKESFSKEADPTLIETIAANNDIVLTAIGD